ncbi:retrovirus-related pol polyprotein from transposon TNT 1-94 [Tanacetum coccineum]
MKVKESLNMTFDESLLPTKLSPLVDDDVGEEESIEYNTKVVNNSNEENESIEVDEVVNIKESKNHPLEQVIANDVWDLVPLPMSQTIIGTKWVFRNKLNKNGIVSRNKARLVSQGYNQQEGIDYDETYALVARLKSIRILLVVACANDFKLYQMDVKSAFLNRFINKEVYVAQPLAFIDFEKPNYVYKLKKALYGLKQAPKTWPDIMFSVCLCARFQENPKTTHLEADEVFSIWKAFGGNTHDLGSFREETDKTTDLHQNLLKIMLTERGDSVASIKRHRHDLRSDGVSTLVTPSEHG